MTAVPRTTIATVLLCLWSAGVFAEIYMCEGDDGVTTYQDQPCPVAEPAAVGLPEEAIAEAEHTRTAPADPPETEGAFEEAAPLDPELMAACKKRYRDEIDRVFAELQKGIPAGEQDAYRERARALSQQLSRCEYDGADKASGDRRSEPAGRDL